MRDSLITYYSLNSRKKNALNLAAWKLIELKIAAAIYSFKSLTANLVQQIPESNPPKLDHRQQIKADDIRWAVAAVAARLPWTSGCLVRALASQRLLRRKGIPGVLYLGTFLDSNDHTYKVFKAHAWVKCGDEFIAGEFSNEPYSAVVAFSWD